LESQLSSTPLKQFSGTGQQALLAMQLVPHSLNPARQVVVEQALVAQAKLPGQSASAQQAAIGMHAAPHGLVPVRQLALHMRVEVSHFTTRPDCGGQSASMQQPSTHSEPHTLPVVQVKSQRVPSQVALPPAGVAQGVHEVPQELTLLSSAHTPPQS
jgi:hypothetical protein